MAKITKCDKCGVTAEYDNKYFMRDDFPQNGWVRIVVWTSNVDSSTYDLCPDCHSRLIPGSVSDSTA